MNKNEKRANRMMKKIIENQKRLVYMELVIDTFILENGRHPNDFDEAEIYYKENYEPEEKELDD